MSKCTEVQLMEIANLNLDVCLLQRYSLLERELDDLALRVMGSHKVKGTLLL